MAHPYFDVPVPTVLGHRGAAGDAPENTLASFALGLELGAHILESDVHATRDGVPVLVHDPDVGRIAGRPARVVDLDWAELRTLDASADFAGDLDAIPQTFRPFRIPTLEEAFEAFPGARFNLEIKCDAPGLVERVVELVGAHGRAPLTLLAAERDERMARIQAEVDRRGVDVALGAALGDVLEFVRTALAGTALQSRAMALQIPVDFGGRPFVTRELVEHAHAHGRFVHAWTVNDEDEMRRLLALGVDGIVTDRPGVMAALLRAAR